MREPTRLGRYPACFKLDTRSWYQHINTSIRLESDPEARFRYAHYSFRLLFLINYSPEAAVTAVDTVGVITVPVPSLASATAAPAIVPIPVNNRLTPDFRTDWTWTKLPILKSSRWGGRGP